MKNKVLYMTALVVCALGMTACMDGKNDKLSEQLEQEELGTRQEIQETGQEMRETEQEIQEPGKEMQGLGKKMQELGQEMQGPGQEIQESKQEIQGPGQELSQQDEQEQSQETGLDGGLYVQYEDASQEYKAKDGTVILTIETRLPVVVSGNEQAARAINDYVRGEGVFDGDMFRLSEEEAVEWAENDYEAYGRDSWPSYEWSMGYVVERMDDKVISFTAGVYSYMGGAHPNTYEKGITFDTQTGKRLMLADVVEEEETASAAVLEFLLAETKKEEYENVFFSDYEQYLADLFSEETWYLGEDGFHIIANTYSIAPYVAGDFDFVIPYEQADFLKEKYR